MLLIPFRVRLASTTIAMALGCAAPLIGAGARAQRSAQPRATSASTAHGMVHLVIDTDKGEIGVSLDSAHAPSTVANFLRYVDAGFFTGGQFYRTVISANQPADGVRISVIQGGANPARASNAAPPIALERTSVTGLRHHDGTLSMARAGPNTATTEFFICLGDQPALDFGGHRNPDGQGFAAFGHVTSGMEVVRAIHAARANGQQLVTPIVIRDIRRANGG
jgi:peptidyl-prolyl cis-trans isomerase A (cyclophilin A)